MATRKYNKTFLDKDEYEVIKALLLLEWYCLDKRGIANDNCDSCVMSVFLKDGKCCPFDADHHAPGDLEVREEVYNGGPSLIMTDVHGDITAEISF